MGSPDFLNIRHIAFCQNIVGAVLDFQIGLCQILSDDTQTEQLDTADKNNHTDGGSPADNRITKEQFSKDDEYQCAEWESSHANAKPRGDAQRCLGEVDNAVDSILEQLPEIPLGFSGNPLYIFVG